MLDTSLNTGAKEQRIERPGTDSLSADIALFKLELERGDYSAARLRADALLSAREDNRAVKQSLCFAGYVYFQRLVIQNPEEARDLADRFKDLQWGCWLPRTQV